MAAEALAWLALPLGLYALLYYNFLKGAKCRNETSLRGKTVLITGGNTGIGQATALDLARRGARVILACRDRARAEAAVYDIRRACWLGADGNRSPKHMEGTQLAKARLAVLYHGDFEDAFPESGNNEVLFMSLDLASFKSVRGFAEAFLKSEPRLDILINNAGLWAGGRSEDGLNLAFQVNHLSHFLLTHLLLGRLKHCAPSRVVVVASSAHRSGKIDFQNIHKPVDGHLQAFHSYCNSKLANILYVQELASRLEGTDVTCYALHPGVVNTAFFRYLPVWLKPLFLPFSWLLFRDETDGAQTSIYCATQEGIEMYSGRYFADCWPLEPKPHARDAAVAQKLWEASEKMVGLAA